MTAAPVQNKVACAEPYVPVRNVRIDSYCQYRMFCGINKDFYFIWGVV